MRLQHARQITAALLTLAAGAALPWTVAADDRTPPPAPPPPISYSRLPAPKTMIQIPESLSYFVAGVDVDIVFHTGYWWTPKDGHWHRSQNYRGPFVRVPVAVLPAEIVHLRPDFRVAYGNEKHIPYGQWKKSHRDKWKKKPAPGHGHHGEDPGHDHGHDRHHHDHDDYGGNHGKGNEGGWKRH